jgi:hypothetical protein
VLRGHECDPAWLAVVESTRDFWRASLAREAMEKHLSGADLVVPPESDEDIRFLRRSIPNNRFVGSIR